MNKQFLLVVACLVFGFKIECTDPAAPVVIVHVGPDELSQLKTQKEMDKFFTDLKQRYPESYFLLASCFEDKTPDHQDFCRIADYVDLEGYPLCKSASDLMVEIDHFQAIIRPNGVVDFGFSIPVTLKECKTFLVILALKINVSLRTSSNKRPALIERAVSTPSSFKPVFKK